MNKLTLIIALILSFGFIATGALAGSNYNELSPSKFFYGETIDKTVEGVKAHTGGVVTKQATDLSVPEFFYGYSIHNPVGVTVAQPTVIIEKRTTVPPESLDLLLPEYFFGYTAEDPVVGKCTNC